MAMFLVFLFYLKLNDSGWSELRSRATARMTANAEDYVPPSPRGGYQLLFQHFKRPGELEDWFLSLLSAPALLLAAFGALFWAKWSRRLSRASGEAARRAAFRIPLCMILMQI